MKLTTSITVVAVLAALAAFLVTPAGAEDEPPAPGPAGEPARAGPRAQRGGPPAAHLARAADADRDGAVSAEEWQAFVDRLQKAFGELDKDGDGALSREELPRPQRGPDMRGRRGPPEGMRAGPPEGMRRGPDARGPQRGPRGGRQGFGPREERGPRPPDGETVRRGPRPPDGETVRRGGGRREGMRAGAGGPQHGPAAGGPQDLGARIDRLTAALEKLLERLESRPPR